MMIKVFHYYVKAFNGLPTRVWLLSVATLINRAGTMVVPFLAIYLKVELGLTAMMAGQLVALYGVGALVGALIGGKLCNHVDSLNVQAISLIISAVALIILSQQKTAFAIGCWLVVTGIFLEGYRPASSVSFTRFTLTKNRARAFALERLAINAGMTIGPFVGGMLAVKNYSFIFYGDALTCVAASIYIIWLKRSIKDEEVTDENTPHASASSASSVWRDGLFLYTMALSLLVGIIMFQGFSTLPLFFKERYQFNEFIIGIVFGLNTVFIIFFEMVIVHAVERFTRARMIALGSLLTGLGFGLIDFGYGIAFALWTVLIWTLGEILTAPLLGAFVANRAPQKLRGSYMGVFSLCFALASIFAPLIGMSLYQMSTSVLWIGCIAAGGIACLGFLLPNVQRAMRD